MRRLLSEVKVEVKKRKNAESLLDASQRDVGHLKQRRTVLHQAKLRLGQRIKELEAESDSAQAARSAHRIKRRAEQEVKDILASAQSARSRSATGAATTAKVAELEATVEKLQQALAESKKREDEIKADGEEWAEAFADLEERCFELKWPVEEMKQWGTTPEGKMRVPYPPEVVMLEMEMCAHEAMASQTPFYIKQVMATFVPQLLDMPVPSPQTVRTRRLGLLPLCDLVAAIKIAKSLRLVIHQDGTSKWQRKLGCAVVMTDEGTVMAGGVYTQKGGTAKETAKPIFSAALQTPQATLESARAYLIKQEDILEGKAGPRKSERDTVEPPPPTGTPGSGELHP